MMYAYIKYVQDGKRSVLPVSLIQRFTAKSNDNLPSAPVKAYWRMPGGEEEGYYDAHVLYLAGTESEVCRHVAKIKRISVPVIFTEDGKIKEVERPMSHENDSAEPSKQQEPAKQQEPSKKQEPARKQEPAQKQGPAKKQRLANDAAPTAKEVRQKKKIAHDRRMGELLPPKNHSRAPRRSHSDTDSSSDDELCLKSELRRANRTIRRLEEKLQRSERTNRRLTNALLQKIEVAAKTTKAPSSPVRAARKLPMPTASQVPSLMTPPVQDAPQLASQLAPQLASQLASQLAPQLASQPAPQLACSDEPSCDTNEDVPEDAAVGPVADAAEGLAGDPAGDLRNPAEDLAGGPAVAAVNATRPAPLDVVDGQRYLGHGIFVPQYKFESAKARAATDSRFCGLLLRQLYTEEEMVNRSVTGQPSRRNLKKGAPQRRPITPAKVEAVKVGLSDFIKGKQTALADGERLDRVKTILSNFFSEKNRPEREPRKPKAGVETPLVDDPAV